VRVVAGQALRPQLAKMLAEVELKGAELSKKAASGPDALLGDSKRRDAATEPTGNSEVRSAHPLLHCLPFLCDCKGPSQPMLASISSCGVCCSSWKAKPQS
jgi:hypothetical protein